MPPAIEPCRSISLGTEHGFTLIEMVVAIAIFAVIAGISYTSLNQFALTRSHLEDQQRRIAQLQNAFTLLGRDIRYLSNRSVRDELGAKSALFSEGSVQTQNDTGILNLTTAWRSPTHSSWSNLERVKWRIEDQHLIRGSWRVLDQAHDSQLIEQTVLDDVSAVELTFYKDEGNKEITLVTEWDEPTTSLLGIEVLITIADEITYRRLFETAH